MKQNLQFKASQHLSLTPQLQQSIKLLQMSSAELNQELEILIQQNPLIEILEEDVYTVEKSCTKNGALVKIISCV
jgi:RNA polymerase sigma-54 factor